MWANQTTSEGHIWSTGRMFLCVVRAKQDKDKYKEYRVGEELESVGKNPAWFQKRKKHSNSSIRTTRPYSKING